MNADVGCGNIFETYLRGLCMLGSVNVAGCAGLDQSRRKRMAKAHHLRAYPSMAALLDDDLVGFGREHHAVDPESDLAGSRAFAEYALQGRPLDGAQELA